MPRDRLLALWRAVVVAVVLAGVLVVLRVAVPDAPGALLLAVLGAFALVGFGALVVHRPRPITPAWIRPAVERSALEAIADHRPLTPRDREAGLDRARRAVWLLLLQVMLWSVQAILWSGPSWSSRWLQVVSVAALIFAVPFLVHLRRRIARIDDYDDTVPPTPAAAPGPTS